MMGAWRLRLAAVVLAVLVLAPDGETQIPDPYAKAVPAFNRGDLDAVKALAQEGDAAAQFLLGLMYETGRGVAKNDTDAARWYRLSAQQGNADAQRNLGQLYESGRGVPQSFAEAQRWYRLSAEQGDAQAQLDLGYLYSSGEGAQKNDAVAAEWFRLSAEQGNPDAQYLLGYVLYFGLGVPENKEEAAQWYRRAADQGNVSAQYMLGYMYWHGYGVQKVAEEAVRWYRSAAEQGHVGAQSFLGRIYSQGEGVRKDDSEAVRWYRLAADQGEAAAQSQLGFMYTIGRGVSQDYVEAAQWLRRAADQGDAGAQSNLGVLYAKGQGVSQNYAEAVRFYRLAADQGIAVAQSNLGAMYYNGQGVPENFVEAYKWWSLAAAQGYNDSAKNRDIVRSVMTPAQIAEGQRLAAAWKPTAGAATTTPESGTNPGKQTTASEVESTGSGFFITAAGHLLTNAHVVEGCSRVSLAGGSRLTILDVDAGSDLALLKTGATSTRAPMFLRQGRGVRLADSVVVAGFPLTGLLSSGLNVTTGTVSALAGPGDDRRLIQITAPVQPGNSGGPLLDQSGNVVGVVVSKLDAVAVASVTGDIPQNVNFAISLGTLQAFLDANAVDYGTHVSSAPKSNADVAEIARASTVQIECRN